MDFITAVKTCFGRYATFSGRARRPEYWWFVLFIILGSVITSVIDGALFGFGTVDEPATQVFNPVFSLATFLPLLAAGWRRMHDTGRPGWYLLIPFALSIATMFALMLGVFGFSEMEMAGADEEVLRTTTGGMGLAGMAIAGSAHLILTVLIIWWLSRPTQAGANKYGDES